VPYEKVPPLFKADLVKQRKCKGT